MLFVTTQFLIFFLIVGAVYWSLPWHRARILWLLAASIYFYASWNASLALLVCCTACGDYLIGLGMERAGHSPWRRRLMWLSVLGNLGVLCYFKYANFFLRSLEEALLAAGQSASLPVLRVLLPVGISFYTFEAINYTVDVYLGRTRAERSLPRFLLFILFFPHLVAGPIVRARDFLPQIARRKRWSWLRAHVAARLILLGLIKKLVIADRMAAFADPVFANPGAHSSATLWMAALAYALQVYGDFSGYTDLALGLAHLLGFRLAENFNMPYLAPNIAEFWRRWHISLSSWLRDYLFIPLGGSRGGPWKTARNLLVVMTLAGLWHGAAWPFVVFGLVQGCFLIIHRGFRGWCESRPGLRTVLESGPGTAARVAFTFCCFCVSLVVFRCVTLADGWTMLLGMFTAVDGLGPPLQVQALAFTVALVALGHWLGCQQRYQLLLERVPAPAWGLVYGALLTATLVLAPDSSKAFVYFQF